MNNLDVLLDIAMCVLWMVTYTLVLIGTIKYQYPLISPMAQTVIAPFEFSAFVLAILMGIYGFNYAILGYLYWTIIEIAIFIAIIRTGFIPKNKIACYIILTAVITGVMIYLVAIKHRILVFSYVNSFVGDAIWLIFILKNGCLRKPITLAVYIVKIVADCLAGIVYFGKGSWLVDVLSVLLPLLDSLFVVVYFIKGTDNMTAHQQKRKEPRYETTI